jgi:hypothetical protein
MRDELTDEQRARLCIFTELNDSDGVVSLDAWDLLRVAHWVETGRDPDGASTVEQGETLTIEDSPAWAPAVR